MKELVPLKISKAAELLRPTAAAYKTARRFAQKPYDNLAVAEKHEQEWRYYNVCYLLHLGEETGHQEEMLTCKSKNHAYSLQDYERQNNYSFIQGLREHVV